jgi:superfamily II DNA or RNA helicase
LKITVIDNVFSKVATKEDAEILATFLCYKSAYWKQTQFRKIEKAYSRPLVKKGVFLTGFIPRIEEYCKLHNIPLEITHPPPSLPKEYYNINNDLIADIPIPGGLRLKQDQVEAIANAIHYTRGVIWHPTGSGKTIIFLSFLTLFPKSRALIIVNSTDLLYQISDRAKEFFPGEVGVIGGGIDNPKRITVATIQSLVNSVVEEQDWFKSIDIVIADESHHISKLASPFESGKGGTYARVLSIINAPLRFGFTATIPYLPEAVMSLEGYIGPVISKKKISEVDRLAKIRVVLKKLPITLAAREAKQYSDVYKYGVTFNSRRHKLVLETADKLVQSGRTVLILVTIVQHGENILNMAHRLFPNMRIEFVWSKIPGEVRKAIKKDLNEGLVDVVIADAVWKEGVDIPTLGSIINAAGGKSEINTLQSLGRGLRTVPGIKEDVILVDLFDPSHKYLVEHLGHRISLYCDEGWFGESF